MPFQNGVVRSAQNIGAQIERKNRVYGIYGINGTIVSRSLNIMLIVENRFRKVDGEL